MFSTPSVESFDWALHFMQPFCEQSNDIA